LAVRAEAQWSTAIFRSDARTGCFEEDRFAGDAVAQNLLAGADGVELRPLRVEAREREPADRWRQRRRQIVFDRRIDQARLVALEIDHDRRAFFAERHGEL